MLMRSLTFRSLTFLALLLSGLSAQAGDVFEGQERFKQCLSCHAIGPDAKNLFGPQLNGIFEKTAGSAPGYDYSQPFKNAAAGGILWNDDSLDQFLENPLEYMPGTKMAFPGVRDPEERAHLIAFLRAVGVDGVLPPEPPAPTKAELVKEQKPKILPADAAVPTHGVLHLGRVAMPEEVAAWDIDIRPDGMGLPKGAGTVEAGGELYDAQCAACHGVFGEGTGRWPVLAGGFDTLAEEHPEKTIGSYWPYLSTVFDYVRRAMPFGNARSLSDDEVYAITAYLLYLNDMADEDFELNSDNFASIKMPNELNFIQDTRTEEDYFAPTVEPCMSNCMDTPAKVTMRARVLDVTPDGE